MSHSYEALSLQLGLPVDASTLTRLKEEYAAQVGKLDLDIADAKEKHGVVELGAAIMNKAQYLGSVGDKDGAVQAFATIPEKALSTGGKADVAMSCARLGLIHGDKKCVGASTRPKRLGSLSTTFAHSLSPHIPPLATFFRLTTERLGEAKTLNDKGGDWDRRNRLKVYDGLLALSNRDFKRAGESLLDSVSTFTALELMTFEQYMFYTVLVALKTLERPVLKKKIIESSDVIGALGAEPLLSSLANSFYYGRYAEFLSALINIYPRLCADRFFAPHASWYLREMRVAAYVQFLDSYKSVTLGGMAEAFGVGTAFLDQELSSLIAGGRVAAKLDATTGIIESSRADTKNQQYLEVMKQGDLLLNKIQRLARVIS